MSNDKKQRAAAARMRAQFIEKSDGRIRSLEDKVIVYVQGTNPYIRENDVKKLIHAAYGKIVEDMPFENGRMQYKTEIRQKYIDALYEGWPVIDISAKPFTKPTTIRNHRAFMNAQPD